MEHSINLYGLIAFVAVKLSFCDSQEFPILQKIEKARQFQFWGPRPGGTSGGLAGCSQCVLSHLSFLLSKSRCSSYFHLFFALPLNNQ